MRIPVTILWLLLALRLEAQTLGGNTVFSFLELSPSPQLTALGGVNVSHPSRDPGLAFNNPSLLKPDMHARLHAVFNGFYADIHAYHLSVPYFHEKLNTNFLWGVHYLSYGKVQETDASGNLLGELRPTDWVMQVSASRSYLQKWNYGATLKFIQSNYGQFRSNGIAMDIGVLYSDTAKLFTASLVARNMGFQLKKYYGTVGDDLPFDLQIGLTRRLANAPFSFSVSAHHLHQFDIRYNDIRFNEENGFDTASARKFTFDKLFRHFVFATTIHLGERVEVQAGYNHLRRKELNIGNAGNGLNGFSLGIAVFLNKLDIRYVRSHYQNNTGYNQFGLVVSLDEYFSWGTKRKKEGKE